MGEDNGISTVKKFGKFIVDIGKKTIKIIINVGKEMAEGLIVRPSKSGEEGVAVDHAIWGKRLKELAKKKHVEKD